MSNTIAIPHGGRGEPPLGERHYDKRPGGTYVVAACCDPCWTSRIAPSRRTIRRPTTPPTEGTSK